jgi:hypothetical protein
MTSHHQSLRRLGLAGAIALLCALAVAQPASASHLKGGSLSTAIDSAGLMTIHMKNYMRYQGCSTATGNFNAGVTITAPDGTTQVGTTLSLPATRCLGATILYEGDGTVDLTDPDPAIGFGPNPPAGVYTVTHSNCCRVSGTINSSNASFSLTSTVRLVTGQATGSPRYVGTTSTGAARNYDYNGDVTASDPDGGTLVYGLAQRTDASAPYYDDGAPDTNVVSLTGSLASVNAATTGGWNVGDYFVYKTQAIDDQGDRTDQDILVTVTDNKPPAFDALPDPYTVTAGTADALAIGASDPDNSTTAKSDTVTISHGTLPDWASLTSTAGNPATADLAVNAPVGAGGMFLVSLDAADDDPAVTLLDSKVLRVKVVPAAPNPGSGPTSTTTDTGTTVHFDAIDGATYECRLDGGAWAACTATTELTGLAAGHHMFSVRQTSDVGPGRALDIEWDVAAAAVAVAVPPIVTAVPAASTPVAHVCISRRDVRLHWRVRKSVKTGRIKVAINGVQRASLAPSARSFLVRLAGRMKSTVRVRVSTTSRGHKLATARTYRVCAGKVARTPLRSLQLRYVH